MLLLRILTYHQAALYGSRRSWGSMSLLLSLIMLVLTACSSAVAPRAHASPQATKPAIASGTLLYQADWSHDLDGWQAAKGWQVHDAALQTSSADQLTIIAPYHITVSNYAIDVRIQVVSIAHTGAYLSLNAKKAAGKDGYIASVLNLLNPGQYPNGLHPQAQAYIDPMGSMTSGSFETIDYDPKFQPHTYRVEVSDSSVRFSIDGNVISDATSTVTDHLSNGPIEMHSSLAILRVSSFRISAL